MLKQNGQSQDDQELKQQLNFHPCGEVNEKGQPLDKYLLFRLIGYSCCIGTFAFRNIVSRFLEGANLESAILQGANLYGANLYGANLKNIAWDNDTNWNNLEGLDKAKNVPKKLK